MINQYDVSTDSLVKGSVQKAILRQKIFKIISQILIYLFLTIFALFMLLPFYWMVVTSLKSDDEIAHIPATFLPGTGSYRVMFINYPLAMQTLNAGRLITNTVIVGVVSTVGTLVTTVMAAFAFSRIKFPGRDIIFTIFLATMMIPGEMMVITNYITVTKHVKNFFSLFGIQGVTGIDTYWAMIVPFLISVYYIYLLRQTFRQIPNELYYAAKVDGTSNFKYLMKIMIPIAKSTLITISILKLMGAWNAYVWPMMVTRDSSMYLITTGLRTAFKANDERVSQGLQMAATTVVTAPLLLVFIFLRKYIMRGVSRSGIKG